MERKSSFLMKSIAVLSLGLGAAAGLFAQPALQVSISGTLGPIISGSGDVTSGTYVSGITSATGSGSCLVDITAPSGSGATATITLAAANTPPLAGTILLIQTPGSGYSHSPTPTTATPAAGGTATCVGTSIVVTTKVDDSLGLDNVPFEATIPIPVDVTYNATSETWMNLAVTFCTPNCTSPTLSLPCTAKGVFTANPGANETFALSECTFSELGGLIKAGFTATVSLPVNTLPAPLPVPFSASLINSPDTASSGTYTMETGTFINDATQLGISGTIVAVCPSTGTTACPTESLSPSTPLNFSAQAGGSAPPAQTVTVSTTPTETAAWATATTVTTPAGGTWLTATAGGQLSPTGTITVNVNPTGLAASPTPYTGTIKVYTSASNSPQTVTVNFTVSSVALPNLGSTPSTLTTFTYSPAGSSGTQTLAMTSSTATSIPYTFTSAPTWLTVSPSSGTAPGTSETISVNTSVASGLATGTYTGNVVFTCSSGTCGNSGGTYSVAATLTVTAALSPVPTSVTFNYTIGGSTPGAQTIAVSSTGGAITYTASAATTTGGAWLAVAPTTSVTTPDQLSASVNAGALTGLGAGTYKGSITLTPAITGNTGFTIPATLVVVSPEPTLVLSNTKLTFNMVDLGSLPAQQNVGVTASNGATIPFTTSVTLGNAWLAATASGGSTPGSFNVSILPNSLTPGTYTGTVQVSSTGATNTPTVTVTLVVGTAPTISATPSSLTFAYQTGGSTPGGQTVNIAASSGALNFTATPSTTSGGGWLAVLPTSGTTPLAPIVSLVPSVLSTLGPGTYTGSISIASAQASNSPQTVAVTLTVSALPSLQATPSSLSANYTINGSVPTFPTVAITSSNAAAPITGVSASTTTPWLSVSQNTSTTPVTLTVLLVPAALTSLPAGLNNGTIMITGSGASNSPLSYTVALTVSAQPTLSVTPSSLSFSGTAGGANPANQTLSVAGANGTIAFTASASSTGNWLSVTPTSGSTPATLQVAVNTTGLAATTYSGSILVTSTTAGTTGGPFTIPVTLNLSANSLTASPTSLTFTYTLGATAPTAQTVNVGSTTAGLSFTAASSPSASWLSISPASGVTPLGISASIVTTGLTAGTYNTSIAITAAGAGNSPLLVPVKLTVTAQPSLTVTPTTLSFSYLTGGAVPAGQSVALATSNNAATAFTAVPSASWLQVSPTSGTTPASLMVTIVPGNLAAGTYNGTVTVSATGYNSATVSVSLVITQPQAVIVISGNTGFTLANTSAPATSTLAISASNGSAQAFTIAAGVSQYNWLSISPSSGTTPANVTLTANPAGLIPGIYTTPITVTMPGLPIPTKTITAQLTVTGSNLVATPSMLTFSYQPGATFPPAQTISLTLASGSGTVPLASVTSNVQWLIVSSASSAPATLKVSVNPGLLTTGTYLGSVIVTAAGSATPTLEIPVTITVLSATQLTVTPSSLTFTYAVGGTVPAAQSLAVASGNALINFTVTAPTWLTVSPASGTTPGSVMVTANPAGLGAGTFTGTITIAGAGTNSVAVPVTLTVTSTPQLVVAPTTLTFNSPVGGPAPAPQTLTVTSTSGALTFTATASAAWLSVTPASGTTPATVAVSANPTGLAQGTYTGAISLVQGGGGAQTTMIPVTLQVGVATTPTITITGVINAASGVATTVAPGMAISIFGTALGPQTPVSFALPAAGGTVATTLGGTQVLFDGTAVPIIYTSATQVNALVPFELASKASTVLTVSYNNLTSAGMTLPVVAAEPGLFTASANGKGEGAILNQDGSINSASNPAAPGSIIQLFGTGAGVTVPPSIDGALNPDTTTGALALTTTATVGGESADVYYAGPAPTLVSGIFQIDVTLPTDTAAGNIAVVITLSCTTPGSANCLTASSQAAVTVAVQ